MIERKANESIRDFFETGGHDARPCYFHYGLGVGG